MVQGLLDDIERAASVPGPDRPAAHKLPPVAILAGGSGSRLAGETVIRANPLIEIGGNSLRLRPGRRQLRGAAIPAPRLPEVVAQQGVLDTSLRWLPEATEWRRGPDQGVLQTSIAASD